MLGAGLFLVCVVSFLLSVFLQVRGRRAASYLMLVPATCGTVALAIGMALRVGACDEAASREARLLGVLSILASIALYGAGAESEREEGFSTWRWQAAALGVLACAAWRAVTLSRGEAEPTLMFTPTSGLGNSLYGASSAAVLAAATCRRLAYDHPAGATINSRAAFSDLFKPPEGARRCRTHARAHCKLDLTQRASTATWLAIRDEPQSLGKGCVVLQVFSNQYFAPLLLNHTSDPGTQVLLHGPPSRAKCMQAPTPGSATASAGPSSSAGSGSSGGAGSSAGSSARSSAGTGGSSGLFDLFATRRDELPPGATSRSFVSPPNRPPSSAAGSAYFGPASRRLFLPHTTIAERIDAAVDSMRGVEGMPIVGVHVRAMLTCKGAQEQRRPSLKV